MSILDVKYAVANADCTAFIYVKSGRPDESPLPMISGMSDTQQGCLHIIETFRRGLSKQIIRAKEELAMIGVGDGTQATKYLPERRKLKEDWIRRLEAMEAAKYHVVELTGLVVA